MGRVPVPLIVLFQQLFSDVPLARNLLNRRSSEDMIAQMCYAVKI